MARRTLHNLDERILLETIRQGALCGVDSISAKTVAANCDVTDTTIFTHFSTKEKLLLAAFTYIDHRLNITMDLDSQLNSQNVDRYALWLTVFEFFVYNPDMAHYFSAYRHRPNFTYYNDNPLTEKYVALCRKLFTHKEHNDAQYLGMWIYIGDSTATFANFITSGILPNDDSTRQLAFSTIFNAM